MGEKLNSKTLFKYKRLNEMSAVSIFKSPIGDDAR